MGTMKSSIAKSVVEDIFKNNTSSTKDFKYHLILDDEHQSYLILMDGWMGEDRIYGILIHLEAVEDKRIWVHEDNTDLVVVDRLLERGIESKEIVIGWHAPHMREDTEFATV